VGLVASRNDAFHEGPVNAVLAEAESVGVDLFEGRQDFLERGARLPGLVPLDAAQPRRLESRGLGLERPKHLLVKTNHDDLLVLEARLLDLLKKRGDDLSAALDLDVNLLLLRDGREHFRDCGDGGAFEVLRPARAHVQLAQLRQRRIGDNELPARDPLRVLVMDADDLAIPGEPEVPLYRIGPLPPRQLERRYRVLRGFARRPPMRDDHRPVAGCRSQPP